MDVHAPGLRCPNTVSSPLPLVGVAGTRSGSGKTLLALALMEHYQDEGHVVQPFKVGPDHIDPLYHRALTGRVSPALDGVYSSRDDLEAVVSDFGNDAGIGVVEGVMGLYDGRHTQGGTRGSTAEVFGALEIPFLLVTDARGRAQSVAAELNGFLEYGGELDCRGVVVNHLHGERHRTIVETTLERRLSVPVFGCLCHVDALKVPTRHLGLHSGDLERRMETLRERIRERLLPSLRMGRGELPSARSVRGASFEDGQTQRKREDPVIGVARDPAFQFYYPRNLRLLREAGARLRSVSPCDDDGLPADLDGLYLGGGYPEEHLKTLANNRSFREDLRRQLDAGLPVLAECGGLMYLSRSLQYGENRCDMVGWFPLNVRVTSTPQALGYVEGRTRRDSPLGPAGTRLVGHEFHYSVVETCGPIESVVAFSNGEGLGDGRDGLVRNNAWGSYAHLYFAASPGLASRWVQRCRAEGRARADVG